MSFESGSMQFRMYRLPRALPEPVLAGFQDRVAPPMDRVRDQPVYGWVTGRHLLDRQVDEVNSYLGGYLRLCLLEAERKIPPSLLRAEMKQEELARLAVSGEAQLSRKEKTQLKQEVMDRLLPTMPPQLKGYTFVTRPGDGWLFAETLAEKQVDVFVSYMREALGFPPQVMTPEVMAAEFGRSDCRDWDPCSFSEEVEPDRTSDLPGHDFMTWLWYQSEMNPDKVPAGREGTVGVLVEGPLTLVMEGGGAHEISLRKGNPTRSAEARACLLAGKKLRKATVSLVRGDTVWRMNLDGELMTVRGFKPVVPEGNLDFVSRFQDRMLQLETAAALLRGLMEAFVEERKSRNKWSARVGEMCDWAKSRSISY